MVEDGVVVRVSDLVSFDTPAHNLLLRFLKQFSYNNIYNALLT